MASGFPAPASGALATGDMEHAARLLGRQPLHNRRPGLARPNSAASLGFATANLRIKHNPLPMTGSSPSRSAAWAGRKPRPVSPTCVRPTVGGTPGPLEVHLFETFDRDIYGAHISVRFVHKLMRDEQRFQFRRPQGCRSRPMPRRRRAFFSLPLSTPKMADYKDS